MDPGPNRRKATEKAQAVAFETIWAPQPRQAQALACPAFEVFFGGAKGGGKALGLGTKIPTPKGWKTIEEIREGDEVLGIAGTPTKVLAVTEPMLDRPCFRVTFDDGEEVIADAEHRWLTQTLSERAGMYRLSDEYRQKRRQARAPRGAGVKPWLAERNASKAYEYKTAPIGGIRTTAEIAYSLEIRGAKNHAIPNCTALDLPEVPLPIPPYTLGAWLGDGTTANGAITSPDAHVLSRIQAEGYQVTKWSSLYAWGIAGLKSQLRDAGLLGNKHIPSEYLRASKEQRMALLQGLVDTDGTVGVKGAVEFTTTLLPIAEGFIELVRTFGIKSVLREGPAKLNGRVIGTQYRVKFTTTLPVASLPRKASRIPERTSPVTGRRIIVSAEPIPSVPVKCIQVEAHDGMFLCGEGFIPTHNSDFLLGDYAAGIEEWGSAWRGILFRRSYKELEEIINRSKDIYGKIKGARFVGGDQLTWYFPSGATLRFRSLERAEDVSKYNGHQYPWIGFDELTEFPDGDAYIFMIGCCRSPVGAPCYVRATGNPGRPGHVWVKARFIDPAKPFEIYRDPSGLTRCFIPSKLEDNQILMRNDPEYEKRLLLQPKHLQRALRWGEWDVIVGQVFDEFSREKHTIPRKPLDHTWYRFCSMDWGYAKPFAIGWWAVNEDGRMILYKEWYGGDQNKGLKMGAAQVAEKAWDMSIDDGVTVMVADPACWSKNGVTDTSGNLPPSIAESFEAAGFTMVKGINDRKQGLMRIHELMQTTAEDGRPLLLVMDHCAHWLRTVPYMTYDPRDPEDVDTNLEDHFYDALRYGVMSEYSKDPKKLRRRDDYRVTRTQNYDLLRHGMRAPKQEKDPNSGVLYRSY